jgi:fucose permease
VRLSASDELPYWNSDRRDFEARMSSESPKRKVQPVAAGCVVTFDDVPIVVISFTCFAAFIIYGASNAALGAAVPALSRALSQPESRIGFIFIFRGAGFLTGTLGSAALMGKPNLPLSKEVITCWASILIGITTFFISCTSNYHLVLGLAVFQGLGFGGVDCISNCLFPELWGNRIQPWMQALHLCFGIGAMIGPAMVGATGYVTTYRVLGVSGFVPLVALQLYRFVHGSYNAASSIVAPGTVTATSRTDTPNSDDVSSFYRYASTSISEEDDEEVDMDSTYAPFSLRDKVREYSEHSTSQTNMLDSAADENAHSSSASSAGRDGGTVDTTGACDAENGLSNKSTESANSHPVTFSLRMLILLFYIVYTGMEAGYAGWIPVYVLEENITHDDSQAAYVSATFWATMTIGRMLAVFTAIAFSATAMLRFHLSFSAVCALMFMWVEKVGTVQYALTVSALLGLALSAIYPLVMTIVIDYGYTM